jgi:hypothetical protein
VTWARTAISIVLEIVKHAGDVKGFQVLPAAGSRNAPSAGW